MSHFRLKLLNVSCSSCVTVIEKILSNLSGIQDFQVNFSDRSITISGDIKPSTVISALEGGGYHALIEKDGSTETLEAQEQSKLLKQAVLAGVFGVVFWVFGVTALLPSMESFLGKLIWLLLGVISAIVIRYSGWRLYKAAYKSFMNHHATMDTLITIGTGAAWIYSMFVVLLPSIFPANARHVYFEASLIIIALVNLGAFLEVRARGKASDAIKRLINLQAKTARRVNAQGVIENVPVESLLQGDRIQVRPGEKIAVDGEVIEGSSMIDESMLTGESMPVLKKKGDTIFGSTLNKTGSFIFVANKVGKDTALAQIISLVQKAQNTKPSVARLADKVSSYFAPSILIIAVITALIWFNLGFSIGYILVATMTVLVIACPCALGLAAPISVIVGMGKSAEHGVLIRNGEALQKASKLNTVVLDKTGTLTKGQPEVVDVLTTSSFDTEKLLQIVASVEQNSEHPLAHAIVCKAASMKLKLKAVSAFEAIIGKGVTAIVDNQHLLIGNQTFLHDKQVDTGEFDQQVNQWATLGQTTIYVAIDHHLAGVISVSDPLKSNVKKSIDRFKQLGLDVVMLTGDNKKTAHAVANQVGITAVYAEVLPQDKANIIKQLQANNKVVAMVGDGINDAPALTLADVGFAIGAGTDIAIESADITLVGHSIDGIANAITISKATMRNIKQNLLGAFLYNSIGIPVAAGILYPILGVLLNPMIAGAAMAASSLTVITNANRLRMLHVKRGSNGNYR